VNCPLAERQHHAAFPPDSQHQHADERDVQAGFAHDADHGPNPARPIVERQPGAEPDPRVDRAGVERVARAQMPRREDHGLVVPGQRESEVDPQPDAQAAVDPEVGVDARARVGIWVDVVHAPGEGDPNAIGRGSYVHFGSRRALGCRVDREGVAFEVDPLGCVGLRVPQQGRVLAAPEQDAVDLQRLGERRAQQRRQPGDGRIHFREVGEDAQRRPHQRDVLHVLQQKRLPGPARQLVLEEPQRPAEDRTGALLTVHADGHAFGHPVPDVQIAGLAPPLRLEDVVDLARQVFVRREIRVQGQGAPHGRGRCARVADEGERSSPVVEDPSQLSRGRGLIEAGEVGDELVEAGDGALHVEVRHLLHGLGDGGVDRDLGRGVAGVDDGRAVDEEGGQLVHVGPRQRDEAAVALRQRAGERQRRTRIVDGGHHAEPRVGGQAGDRSGETQRHGDGSPQRIASFPSSWRAAAGFFRPMGTAMSLREGPLTRDRCITGHNGELRPFNPYGVDDQGIARETT